MRDVKAISPNDVGKAHFKIGGQTMPVSSFIGRIIPRDIGKLVYSNSTGHVSVENDEQMLARQEREASK